MKIVILLLCLVVQCSALDTNFVKAIHWVETGGRVGNILGDNGLAKGPFQIHRAYWQDAVSYDKTLKGSYSDVADYGYALKVVTAYLTRYEPEAVKSNNYEILARCHNAGLNWRKKVYKTDGYWNKVQKALYEINKSNKKTSSIGGR